MEDPKLKKTSVKIIYSANDGYRAECEYKGGQGTKHLKTGEEVPPQEALIDALTELARLTALFGFENEAKTAFDDANLRVAEWRKQREAA